MKRIVVIGCGGAGKSTLSKRLGEKLGIEVIHLDKLFWRPNWTRTPEDEWIEIVAREVARERWILDGNFGGTREMRLNACDTVIFMDMPRWLCIYRVLRRTLLYRRTARPDMAESCEERLDIEFLIWVWNYRKSSRQRVIRELEGLGDRELITLKDQDEVARFLDGLTLESNST